MLGTESGVLVLDDAVGVDGVVGSVLDARSNVGVPTKTIDEGIGDTICC